MSFIETPGPWRRALILLALSLAYALTVMAVMRWLTVDGYISMVWLPSGLGLAALLLGGVWLWPGVLLGAWLGLVGSGQPLGASLLSACTNAVEPVLALALMRRLGPFDPQLRRLGDFARLVGAGAAGAMVAAGLGVGALVVSGRLPQGQAPQSLAFWWMGNSLGMLVVAPLLLVWQHSPRGWFKGGRRWESLAFLSLSLVAGYAILLGGLSTTQRETYQAGNWTFLLAAWGAARFGLHGALWVVALAAVEGLVGMAGGLGLFAATGHSLTDQLTEYWFHMVTLTITAIPLAVSVEARLAALAVAQQARAQADQSLAKANQARQVLLSVVEDQKAAEAALLAEKELSERYLDTVEAIILALDTQGRVQRINRKGCQLLGYSAQELRGRNWFDACLPDSSDVREHAQALFRALLSGHGEELDHAEHEVVDRSGRRHLIAWHNTVLLDADGKINGTLSAGEDVTDQRLASDQVQAQLEELRRWQALTLDRESRILSLKAEVNGLQLQNRQAPRYPSALGELAP